jgi:hypothetical protein
LPLVAALAAVLVCAVHSLYAAGAVHPARIARAGADAVTLYLPAAMGGPAQPSGALEDGGSLRSADGAIVGAVAGTLDAPLEMILAAIETPPAPLPAGFVRAGDFHQVAAARPVVAPTDRPFLLGLPVPPGAATDELAAAVLMPPGSVLDGPDAPLWTLAPGRYDAPNDLFVITLAALTPEGLTVALVTDPAFEPIASAAPVAPGRASATVPSFTFFCYVPAVSCTEANKVWLTAELQDAYDDFVTTRGFERPALISIYGWFDDAVDWLPVLEYGLDYSGVAIKDRPCEDGEAGYYVPTTRELVICLEPHVAPGANDRATVRHELFHAIQHSYPRLHADGQSDADDGVNDTGWLIDGTATAAENSSLLMTRAGDRALQRVTTPITDTLGLREYHAQDFWVYTGLVSNQSLAYLRPILTAGATPTNVAFAIPLDDAYWSWAKNQAIEHHEPMGGAFGVAQCLIEIDAIDPANMPQLDVDATYFVAGVLPPLTSAMVEIVVPTGRNRLYVSADNDANSLSMRFKVYEQGEANCHNVPDGTRFLENILPGGRRYVLVSNVSVRETYTYRVVVD